MNKEHIGSRNPYTRCLSNMSNKLTTGLNGKTSKSVQFGKSKILLYFEFLKRKKYMLMCPEAKQSPRQKIPHPLQINAVDVRRNVYKDTCFGLSLAAITSYFLYCLPCFT